MNNTPTSLLEAFRDQGALDQTADMVGRTPGWNDLVDYLLLNHFMGKEGDPTANYNQLLGARKLAQLIEAYRPDQGKQNLRGMDEWTRNT